MYITLYQVHHFTALMLEIYFLTDVFIRCQQLYVLLVSSASVLCLLKDYGNGREKEQFETNVTFFSVVKHLLFTRVYKQIVHWLGYRFLVRRTSRYWNFTQSSRAQNTISQSATAVSTLP